MMPSWYVVREIYEYDEQFGKIGNLISAKIVNVFPRKENEHHVYLDNSSHDESTCTFNLHFPTESAAEEYIKFVTEMRRR